MQGESLFTVEGARIALYAITAGGVAIWVAGAWFLSWAKGISKNPPDDRYDSEPNDKGMSGEIVVRGPRQELIERSVFAMTQGAQSFPLGVARIIESSADRVRFEHQRMGISNAELRFAARPDGQTRVRYVIDTSRLGKFLIGGYITLALGMLSLIVGFLLIQAYAVEHEQLAVRRQTLQMLQCGHFLWPPFLFGGLYRLRVRMVREHVETLIHNLPHI